MFLYYSAEWAGFIVFLKILVSVFVAFEIMSWNFVSTFILDITLMQCLSEVLNHLKSLTDESDSDEFCDIMHAWRKRAL